METNKTKIINNKKKINNITTLSEDLVLTNLKILSNIKADDKVTIINNNISIDSPYISQSIFRWLNGDSRNNTLKNIDVIISNTFRIIDSIYDNEISKKDPKESKESYFENSNSQKLQTFSTELKNSIAGLHNLKITYKTDISICSKIDIHIEKINLRIKKINSLLKINNLP